MRTIKVNPVDPNSIDEAIKEIEKYEQFVERMAKELVEILTEMGLGYAQASCPVRTGAARASITGSMDEGKGQIRAGGHCAYIEFGTGVRGDGGSSIISEAHPDRRWLAIMNWAYGSGVTIFTTKDGRTGWYYPVGDGTYRFTEGMPSRPFMFETAVFLKKEAPKMAEELFRQ